MFDSADLLVRRALFSFALLLCQSAFLFGQGIVQITDSVSYLFRPVTISGDGSKIFYFRYIRAFDGIAKSGNLYMRDVNSPVPELLAENVRVDAPLLSNYNGSSIIFAGYEGLSLVDSAAGCLQFELLDTAARKSNKLFCTLGQLAWAEEANIVVFTSYSKEGTRLLVKPLEGGEAKQIASSNLAGGIGIVGVDPKAQFVYYSRFPGQIVRFDLRTNEEQIVFDTKDPDEYVTGISVTADENRVYFYTSKRSRYKNYFYSRSTGAIEPLLPDSDAKVVSISRDGRWLLVEASLDLTGQNPDRSPELFLISADMASRKQLTRLKAGQTLYSYYSYSAKLNDDGSKMVLVGSHRLPTPGFGDGGEWLYHFDTVTGKFRLMDFSAVQYGGPLETFGDGSSFLLLSGMEQTAEPQIVMARSDGAAFRQLTDADLTGTYSLVSSADAEVLALLRHTLEGTDVVNSVWIYRVRDRALIKIAEQRELYRFLNPGGLPIYGFSIDSAGENLVFSTLQRVRKEDPERLTSYLYLVRDLKSRPRLEVLREGLSPSISGDGRLIAFQSKETPLGSSIFVMRVDGSGLKQIGPGFLPKFSRNGQWLAWMFGRAIVLSNSDHTFEKQLLANGLSLYNVQISADGSVIVGLGGILGNTTNGFFVAFNSNGSEIARVTIPYTISAWALEPSGSRVYFASSANILNNGDQGGEVFAATLAPLRYWAPQLTAANESFTGIALANPNDEPTELLITARDESGNVIAAPSPQSPVSKILQPRQQIAMLLPELLGSGVAGKTTTLEIDSKQGVSSLFITGSTQNELLGSTASDVISSAWIFPLSSGLFESSSAEVESALVIVNPHREPVTVQLKLDHPIFPRVKVMTIPPLGMATVDVLKELLSLFPFSTNPLLEVSASTTFYAELRVTTKSAFRRAAVNISGLQPLTISDSLIIPDVISGGSFQTRMSLVNPDAEPIEVEIRLFDSAGRMHPGVVNNSQRRIIGPRQMLDLQLAEKGESAPAAGYVCVKVLNGAGRVGGVAVVWNLSSGEPVFALDARRLLRRRAVFPHLVQGGSFFTGYSVVNAYGFPVHYRVEIFNQLGSRVAGASRTLAPGEKRDELIIDIFKEQQAGGYFVIEADWPLNAISLIGTASSSSLANMPAQ